MINNNSFRVTVCAAVISITCPARAAENVQPAYVAIGSSYSAGPGVGAPVVSSKTCDRSQSNFAQLVAAKRHYALTDVSCSGATTYNVLQHGQYGFARQIDAVQADTKFVSILIGGNDIDYVGNLDGLSCQDSGGSKCQVENPSQVDGKIALLPASLDKVVAAVRQRAPASHIVLIGYLPAVPGTGLATCAQLPMTQADALRMRGVATKLAQVIGDAAQRNHTGIIRSTLIGMGHDVCSSEPYIAGYHPARSLDWKSPIPYHPTQGGMNAIAAALDSEFAH